MTGTQGATTNDQHGSHRIGYATADDPAALHAQLDWLARHGIPRERTFVDGIARAPRRVGLEGALAAARRGTLTITALDRLAVSEAELEALTPLLVDNEITLDIGGIVSVDPSNDIGRSLFDTYLGAVLERVSRIGSPDRLP